MLHTGTAVELQVFVDLALLARDRRLVQRELHLAGAVGNDLAHQRGVLRRYVVTDELRHVRKPHHPVVEVDPLVHAAEFDITHAMVDGLEHSLARMHDRLTANKPRQVRP